MPSRQICGALARGWWIAILAAGMTVAQSPDATGRLTSKPLSGLAREILNAHNAIRAGVKAPALQWSDQLAGVAQKWADTLLRQHRFSHSPDSRFGENLFDISGAAANPSFVVRQWASESRNYDYRSNTCRGVCGHYTQVVWRSTTRVGCAVARGGGREVWVCNYDPPGNWLGERPY